MKEDEHVMKKKRANLPRYLSTRNHPFIFDKLHRELFFSLKDKKFGYLYKYLLKESMVKTLKNIHYFESSKVIAW